MGEYSVIVLFSIALILTMALLVALLAVPAGIAAHLLWNLLAYGWRVV